MSFQPIAVVGQACVLPGALDPESLWRAVLAGEDLISAVEPGRWRVRPGAVLSVEPKPERSWSDRGGYVRGFKERFDASGFAIPEARVAALDPAFQWTLHCAREALQGVAGDRSRTGLVMGNLSFPTAGLARLAESVWLDGGIQGDPWERFSSGLPAHLAAKALGLGGGGVRLGRRLRFVALRDQDRV